MARPAVDTASLARLPRVHVPVAAVWHSRGNERGCVIIVVASSGARHGGLDGVLLCVLAAAVYTLAVVIEKPVLARVSAVAVTWAACVAGTVACLPFVPALLHDVRGAPASSTLLVVYLGVGPTAIAFTTWAFALSRSKM